MLRKRIKGLAVFAGCLFLFLWACEPRGSNRETIEDDNSYEMLEGEDVPPAEENEDTMDSTDLSEMKRLQDEQSLYRKRLDSIVKRNPNVTYSYVPTESGRIKTVLGDYKVRVDNTLTEDEKKTVAVLLEKRFENRQQMLKYYNQLQQADLPAKPIEGYAAFYQKLQEELNYPDFVYDVKKEGLIFVQMAVEKDGDLSNIKIAENLNIDNDKVEEAVRNTTIEAIKNVDAEWTPAQRDGQAVRSKLEMPVWFDPNQSSS